jgi:hypothetical protein
LSLTIYFKQKRKENYSSYNPGYPRQSDAIWSTPAWDIPDIVINGLNGPILDISHAYKTDGLYLFCLFAYLTMLLDYTEYIVVKGENFVNYKFGRPWK